MVAETAVPERTDKILNGERSTTADASASPAGRAATSTSPIGTVADAHAALVAGDIDRALAITGAILGRHPKHVEATCLLAEALRERGMDGQARDLFLRVLSADPENVIARWALALIHEARGEIETACGHALLAFDLHPGHPEIRQDCSRLLGGPVEMGRAGLGRIYARGHHYQRAAREYRAVLADDSHRLDVRVALAELLWRCGRVDDAAALSEEILFDSPDCLKANVIRGRWCLERAGASEHGSGSQTEGRRLIQRAAALDPDRRLAGALFGNAATGLELPSEEDSDTLPTFDSGSVDRVVDDVSEEEPAEPTTTDSVPWLVESHPPVTADLPPELDPRWRDLLEEEIALDPGAEARLSAALADATGVGSSESDATWREVVAGPEGIRPILTGDLPEPPAPVVPSPVSPKDELVELVGHLPEAEPLIARLIGDGEPVARLELAALAVTTGGGDIAASTCREVLRGHPEHVQQVIDVLRRLIHTMPECVDARRILGDAYMRAGQFQQAIEEYNAVLGSRREG